MSCKKKYIIKADPLTGIGPQGPQGPQGPAGPGVILPLSTDDVDYRGSVLTDILDQLTYTALVINSFTASPTNYEKGQVLTSVALAWAYNKAVTSQGITGTNVVPPTLNVGDRNKVVTLNNVSVNTTITLTADDNETDSHSPKTRQLTLAFLDKLYWGVSTIPGSYNSAFVLGLANKVLASSRQTSFSLSTGASEYIYVAIPAAMGTPTFKTNGFFGGLSLEASFNLTNASGYTSSYNLYRTDNESLGLTAVEIL